MINAAGRDIPEYIEGYGKTVPYQGAFAMSGINFDLEMYGIHEGNVAAAKKGEESLINAINECIKVICGTPSGKVKEGYTDTYYTWWVANCRVQAGTDNEAAIDIVGDWIGSSLPKALICPILFVIGGILSMFVSTNNVAIPTLFTLVPSIFAASGISPVILYMAIAVGCSSTGCFPFSGSGSFGLAMCSDEKLVKPLFNGQMKMAAFQLIIGIILSFVLSLVI